MIEKSKKVENINQSEFNKLEQKLITLDTIKKIKTLRKSKISLKDDEPSTTVPQVTLEN